MLDQELIPRGLGGEESYTLDPDDTGNLIRLLLERMRTEADLSYDRLTDAFSPEVLLKTGDILDLFPYGVPTVIGGATTLGVAGGLDRWTEQNQNMLTLNTEKLYLDKMPIARDNIFNDFDWTPLSASSQDIFGEFDLATVLAEYIRSKKFADIIATLPSFSENNPPGSDIDN